MENNKKRYALLRLAAVDGMLSSGYKSGRRRCREIPVAASIDNTRSAGTVPRSIQLKTVLCAPRPSALASADCPPTFSQASNNACLGDSEVMGVINAQTGNGVNAYSGNPPRQNARMGKQTELNPSAFWRRLQDALRGNSRWEPVNANNVAKVLGMSQGSVHRWYTGVGLPELETALELAKEGGICVDWLLNNVKPKHPISKDPVLRELFEVCEDLSDEARKSILRVARGELLQQGDANEGQKRAHSPSIR